MDTFMTINLRAMNGYKLRDSKTLKIAQILDFRRKIYDLDSWLSRVTVYYRFF